MQRIVGYFDRAYIINLKDRIDRRRQVTQEFTRIGLDIPNDKVHFYEAVRPTDPAGFPNSGTRGAFQSHMRVLELAQQDKLKNILIFEDDVSFRYTASKLIDQIVSALDQEDWDVVYFGYTRPADGSVPGPLSRWEGDILGAHFYAVNGRFVATMLKYMKECESRPLNHPLGGPMVPDGAYNHVRYVMPEIRLLLPPRTLAFQRSSRTDISAVKSFDRVLYLNTTVRVLRTVKHGLRMTFDTLKLKAQRSFHGADERK